MFDQVRVHERARQCVCVCVYLSAHLYTHTHIETHYCHTMSLTVITPPESQTPHGKVSGSHSQELRHEESLSLGSTPRYI